MWSRRWRLRCGQERMNAAIAPGSVDAKAGCGGTVSVLIPTYNRARYLEECIQSMLSQTVAPAEIIVIDDGSTDGTMDVVRGFGDSRIRYIRQENAGKCAALNRALPLATGDYIWLFDDDDVALPDSIERRLELIGTNSGYGFVGGGHVYGHDGPDGGIVVDRARNAKAYRQSASFYRVMVDCYFSLSSVLARRECYGKIGGFDESLSSSEDYDMLIRLAREFEFDVLPSPTFVVRTHNGTRGAASNRYSADQRREKLYRTDAVIGSKIRDGIPLAEFVARDDDPEMDPRKMQLIRRSVVMASKGLIEEMMSDLMKAYLGDERLAISGGERGLLLEAMDSNYVVEGILENEATYGHGLRSLLRDCPTGAGVVGAVIAGIWRICKERRIPLGTRKDRLKVLFITVSVFISAGGVKRMLLRGRAG